MMTALHILLLILKILGIAILSIIGLVLLIILIIMIVPIRYRVDGSYYENAPNGKARVSYLFPLFAFYLELIEKKPVMTIRILGIPIRLGKKKEKKKAKETPKTDGVEPAGSETASEAERGPDSPKEKEPVHDSAMTLSNDEFEELLEELKDPEEDFADPEIPQSEDDSARESIPKPEEIPKTAEKQKKSRVKAEKKPKPEKKPKTEKKPKAEKAKKPEKTPEEIAREKEEKRQKLEKLKSTFEMIKTELENPENKHFLRVVKRSIGKILRHLLPTKLRAYVHYGVEDNPAQMGQILSYAGMLYPLYGKSIRLEPEFDRKVMEGDFKLWGRIRPGTLVCALLRIVFTKRVFQLVKMLIKKRKAK